MKIAICGSMTFSPEMVEVGKRLKELGHEITLPKFSEHYSTLDSREDMHIESASNKIEHDLIRRYFEIIRNNDAVLIYNQTKNGIKDYVGGNSLIEMAFGYVLGKKVFLYNPIPDMQYRDEIEAMQPVCLNGDLESMKKMV